MHWTEMVWQQHSARLAFGNHKGVKIDAQVAKEDLFAADFGSIVAEVPADKVAELTIAGIVLVK